MQVYGPNATTEDASVSWHKTSSGVAMTQTMVAVIDVKTTLEAVFFAASGTIASSDDDYSTFVLTLHDGAGDTPLLSFATNLTNLPDGVTAGLWSSGENPFSLGLAAPVTITPDVNNPATVSLAIAQTGAGASIPTGILRIKAKRTT